MGLLTAVLYLGLGAYSLAWFLGLIHGDFSLLLLILTVVTGGYWLAERVVFLPRRRRHADLLARQARERRAALAGKGIEQVDGDDERAIRQRALAQPWWLDWTAGLFPVIAIVFVLRSFLFEPFKIPTGSMIPTLLVGDLILVNKYHYGIRLPVVHTKLFSLNEPSRGDVAVFRYPEDPRVDYIKRIVGLPGDEVSYADKRLTINGVPVPTRPLADFYDETAMRYQKQFAETLGNVEHRIQIDETRSGVVSGVGSFPHRDRCSYGAQGMRCVVPPGHYFVMGDNRDNSLDSRYWGFVPDDHLKGRAFFVWMNFGDLSRIGSFN